MALRNALVVGCVLLTATLLAAIPTPAFGPTVTILGVGLGVTVLLFSLPTLILRNMAESRVQRIRYSLPDAVDMITMCMSGGLPLHHSLARVSQELDSIHPDLACELKIIGRHLEVGSLDGALTKFAGRLDVAEVRSLTVLVGQTEKQGGSVAGAFEEFSDNVRRTQRQRAEEHGSKVVVKMLFPLVFCLAPPVYLLLLAPAVMELRSFMIQENRPGGILTPDTTSPDQALNPVADGFSSRPFVVEG